jgi:hypothetical protein
MRFYHDSELAVPVEWYFVPDDRDVIPWWHSFGSRLYERRDEPQLPLGERYEPVPWRGGNVPHLVSTGGLCGTREQWESGAAVDDPLPAAWPGTNVSMCCKRPRNVGFGGRALGGCGVIPVCCNGVTLPPKVIFTQVFVGGGCPELDGVPILLDRYEGPPPALIALPVFYRSDILEVSGVEIRIWIQCSVDIFGWFVLTSDPDGDTISYGASTFYFVSSCIPFYHFAPNGGGFAIPIGACGPADGSIELRPAT